MSYEGIRFPHVCNSTNGNIGSSVNLFLFHNYFSALSSMSGMIRPNNDEEASRQGLVLTSMRYILNVLSIIKSYPNIVSYTKSYFKRM